MDELKSVYDANDKNKICEFAAVMLLYLSAVLEPLCLHEIGVEFPLIMLDFI